MRTLATSVSILSVLIPHKHLFLLMVIQVTHEKRISVHIRDVLEDRYVHVTAHLFL